MSEPVDYPSLNIDDLETAEALFHPLRFRLFLELGKKGPSRVKDLAKALEVKQTRLYHHMNVLEDKGFVRVAETRLVSGIQERTYEVVRMHINMDPSIAGTIADLGYANSSLDAMLQGLRRAVATFDYSSVSDPQAEPPFFKLSQAKLDPNRASEFRDRLKSLLAEFTADQGPENSSEYELFVGFYRPAEEEERD